jgi:hypothetical protein
VTAAVIEAPSADIPCFVSAAECSVLFLPPLRPAPLSSAIKRCSNKTIVTGASVSSVRT